MKADTLPSQHARRLEPKVGDDLKAKVVQAAAAKVKKAAKKVEGVNPKGGKVEDDDFDAMAEDKQGVRQRINSGDKTKQTKLNFKPAAKEANPFSDKDAGKLFRVIACVSSSSRADIAISDLSDSEEEQQLVAKKRGNAVETVALDDSDEDGAVGGQGDFDVTTSGSEVERMVAKRPAAKKPAKKLGPMADVPAANKPLVPAAKKPVAATKKKVSFFCLASKPAADEIKFRHE